MKFSTTSFFSVIATLGIIAAVSSCTNTNRFAGTWLGNPERLDNVSDAANATATLTLDFAPDASDSKRGVVDIMAVMEVSQAVSGIPADMNVPYQTNITATASINGQYVFEDGDDDDIIVSFDPTSLKINVDPDGVTFSENLISDTERPVLDSLTAATADHWRVILTSAIRDRFNKYRKIEDIKVHHDDFMSCEVENRDITFRRIGVPD